MSAEIRNLRRRRGAEGITLDDVSQRCGIEQTRLCRIERGRLEPRAGELESITGAIDAIVETRARVQQMAAEAGLELAGVRL